MERGRCTTCRRKPRVHRRGSLTTSGPGGHRLPRAPGGRPGPPPPAGRGQVTPAVCCASPRSQGEAQSPGQGGAGCWRGRRLPPRISLWCFRTREPVPGASGMEEPAEVRGCGGACGGCTPRPGRRHTGAPTRPQTPILAGGTRPAGVAAPLGTGVTPGNVSPDWFHQALPAPSRLCPPLGEAELLAGFGLSAEEGGRRSQAWGPSRGHGRGRRRGAGTWRAPLCLGTRHRVGSARLCCPLWVPAWMPRAGVEGLTGWRRPAAHMAAFYSACLQMGV